MTTPEPKPLALRSHEVAALLEHGKATVVRAVKLSDENTRGCGPGLALLAGNHATWLRDGIGLTWVPFAGSPEVPMPPNKVAEYGPFGAVGSEFWVRETWQAVPVGPHRDWPGIPEDRLRTPEPGRPSVAAIYRADGDMPGDEIWRSPAQMPRLASRLNIKFVAIDCTPNAAGVWEWHGEARRVKK